MFHRGRAGAVAAACAVLVTGCSSPAPPNKPSPVIARVASDTITLAQFNTRYESALTSIEQGGASASDPAQTTELRASVLRSLIVDIVIRQEATKLGLEATPGQIQAEVATDAQQAGGKNALETELAGAGGSIAQLEDEISSDLNEQRLEDHFAQARVAMVEQTLASGANFIATAKQFSDDSGTSASGGDLGVLTAAQLKTYDPHFAAAVEALKVGAYTTTPVHDAGGYDILMLYSKTTKGWGVRHILIYAGNPYNVMDRPDWFTEALFSAIDQLCVANQIAVTLTNAGGNPCTSPSPTPALATPSPKATPSSVPAG
jgi:SurA N-terminal domain/PPIC-type PPIASE domain